VVEEGVGAPVDEDMVLDEDARRAHQICCVKGTFKGGGAFMNAAEQAQGKRPPAKRDWRGGMLLG